MKNKLLLLFLVLSLTASAQSLEFNTGTQLNNFYRFSEEQTASSYTAKMGYDLNIGVEGMYLNKIRLRFTLGLNRYSGGLQASWSEYTFNNYSIDGQINKTVVRFGCYPINFRIKKRLNINIGPQFSMLIHEKVKARYDERLIVVEPYSGDIIVTQSFGNINERHDSYNAKSYVGLNIRVAYDIPISERYYLVPQYSFYTGLTNEFTEFPNTTKSMQNMLGIGIKRKL